MKMHETRITDRGFATYEPEYVMSEAESRAQIEHLRSLRAIEALESVGCRRPLTRWSAPGRIVPYQNGFEELADYYSHTDIARASDAEDRRRREMLGALLSGVILLGLMALVVVTAPVIVFVVRWLIAALP